MVYHTLGAKVNSIHNICGYIGYESTNHAADPPVRCRVRLLNEDNRL